MTLEEIFRRVVRAHLVLIAVCVALPLVAVVVLQMRQPATWVGTVRLQVRADAPTSTTEADAISSRVLALATTPEIISDALRAHRLPGDAQEIARHHVTSQRLGESSVVELSLDNQDRTLAARQTSAVAERVVWFMNRGSRTTFLSALEDVQTKLAEATKRRDELTTALDRASEARRPLIQVRLAAAQASVDQLTAVSSSMALTQASQDDVVAIDVQRPEVIRSPSTLVPRAALAVLLGLLIGAAAAVSIETMRPRVAGIRAVARLFDAPVLGSGTERLAALANAMTLAARRQGLETVVLLGVEPNDEAVARRLLEQLRANGVAADVPSVMSVGAHSAAHDNAVVGGPSIPNQVRFAQLVEVGAADERTAGVVVVSSGSPLQRHIDAVDDVIRTTRWPVVGVIDSTHGHRRGDRA